MFFARACEGKIVLTCKVTCNSDDRQIIQLGEGDFVLLS